MRFETPFGGRLLLVAGVSLATLLAALPAYAAPPTWQLADGSVKASPGLATFDFAGPDKAHLLFSDSPDLIGSKNGTTMTASFTVQGVSGTFTYGGEPSCGGTTATVRLYFESIPPGTKFAFTNYWWSDTAWQVLANGTAPLTLTALVDPTAQWSDWNGQPSSTNRAAFNAAAGNVTAVGLSFGGGCFFENGVGTTDGTGTFTLDSFLD
jgi:hypothetical protein